MASFGCQIGLCRWFTYWTVFLPTAESAELPEFELASLGTDPSSTKVLIFMSQAIDVLQIREFNSEKQRPNGINEDLLLDSSFSMPFIARIMKCTWFTLANDVTNTLSK